MDYVLFEEWDIDEFGTNCFNVRLEVLGRRFGHSSIVRYIRLMDLRDMTYSEAYDIRCECRHLLRTLHKLISDSE